MLIGTAGHIDHGKTTLVKALTGVDADRLPEEKARGITLDLGYAYTPLPGGDMLGFVDVPGHEKLIHNMLAGATGIDFVLLVIAADDGPMPQTREHLELLDLLGLTHGAVALTKIDAVTPERLAAAQAEVRELLAGSGLAGSPLFPLSARSGEGVVMLRTHLERQAALPSRPTGGRFRLAIDRCFSLAGAGTVVTGTVHSGKVDAGATVALLPSGRRARVRSLHVQDRPASCGNAGQRCALALAGDLEKRDVTRGMWLADPALDTLVDRWQGELRVPAGQKALTHLQRVHVHLGSDDILGRVAVLDGEQVTPGTTALVELLLERPTQALRGDRFVLRDAGAQRTVGGGRVLDIFPPARHKRAPARLALLRTMAEEDPAVSLAALGTQASAGVDLVRFAIAWNLDAAAIDALVSRLGLRVVRLGDAATAFAADRWQSLVQRLLDALAREHERAPDLTGVERERLRRMTQANLGREGFDALVAELLAAGRIAQTRAWLHLPEHRASVSAADRDLFAVLKPLLESPRFNPPRVRDVFRATGTPEDMVRQLFRRLARAGELYPVAHDHYFTAATVAELAGIVERLCADSGEARAAALRDIIYPDGSGGRKVAIQILEFFDRIGYTRRVRDAHVVRREAAQHDWGAA